MLNLYIILTSIFIGIVVFSFISVWRDGINVFIGVASSIVAWFILYHVIVPRIAFSKIISKQVDPNEPCGYNYRIKFWNIGKRDIIDLDIYIRVKINGLIKQKKLWHTIELPIKVDKILYVATGENRLIRFSPNNPIRFKRNPFPKDIQEKSTLQTLTLEDILKLGSTAYIRVYVLGNDKFSGSRKIFLSKTYFLQDIKNGGFKKDSSDMDDNIYTKKIGF